MLAIEFVVNGRQPMKYTGPDYYNGCLQLDAMVTNELVFEAPVWFSKLKGFPYGAYSIELTERNVAATYNKIERAVNCANLMVTATVGVERPPSKIVRDAVREWVTGMLTSWFEERHIVPPSMSVRLIWDD